MQVQRLRFPTPTTPASVGLNAALDEQTRVAGELAEAERRATAAVRDREAASTALAELERRAARGGNVTTAQRTKAEGALATAKAEASQPWPERIGGLRAALRDAETAVSRYVGEHFDALAEELGHDASEAARAVDDALESLVSAYQRRERVSQHATAVLATVERPRPNAVPASRVAAVIREAEAALLAGGEAPPVMRRRELRGAPEPEHVETPA